MKLECVVGISHIDWGGFRPFSLTVLIRGFELLLNIRMCLLMSVLSFNMKFFDINLDLVRS